MSYEAGWAALNLEMGSLVPRTEYSITGHWEVVSKVTGIDVDLNSDPALKKKAVSVFTDSDHWDFCFNWATDVSGAELGTMRTNMGHAVYAAGGTDWDEGISSPFKTADDVLAFNPLESLPQRSHSELVAWFNSNYKRRCESSPNGVNMVGTYITVVSGMIDLFGWDHFLMAAGTDEARFNRIIEQYTQWLMPYYTAMAECDSPTVMVHDDIVWTNGPFMHPDWYRANVFPHYRKYLAPLKEAGKKLIFTSDGNYSMFIDDIAGCGFNGFVLEPTTDMGYIAEKYGKTHAFIGNADTRILLHGSKAAIENEVKRCMDIGKKCPGFIMAVGNHIPANTPVESALFYDECYKKMRVR